MTILALATDINDYTGWDGTGAAVYTSSTTSTATNTAWFVSPATGLNTSGFGYGCLWLGFTKQTSEVHTYHIHSRSANGNVVGNFNTASIVLHNEAGNGFIVIRPAFSGSATTTFYICFTTNLTDSTKYTILGSYVHASSGVVVTSFDITGLGTSSGALIFAMDAYSATSIPGSIILNVSLDLTQMTDVVAISFHAPDSGQGLYVHGAVVSTVSLRSGMIKEFIPTSYNGTYKDWVGTIGSFTTSPSLFTSYGTGFYGTNVGDKVTFGNRTDVTLATGYEIRGITLHANVNGGSESSVSVAPYLYNRTSKKDYTGTSVAVTPTGVGAMWIFDKDPITGNKFTTTDYAAYDIGLVRTT